MAKKTDKIFAMSRINTNFVLSNLTINSLIQ